MSQISFWWSNEIRLYVWKLFICKYTSLSVSVSLRPSIKVLRGSLLIIAGFSLRSLSAAGLRGAHMFPLDPPDFRNMHVRPVSNSKWAFNKLSCSFITLGASSDNSTTLDMKSDSILLQSSTAGVSKSEPAGQSPVLPFIWQRQLYTYTWRIFQWDCSFHSALTSNSGITAVKSSWFR